MLMFAGAGGGRKKSHYLIIIFFIKIMIIKILAQVSQIGFHHAKTAMASFTFTYCVNSIDFEKKYFLNFESFWFCPDNLTQH